MMGPCITIFLVSKKIVTYSGDRLAIPGCIDVCELSTFLLTKPMYLTNRNSIICALSLPFSRNSCAVEAYGSSGSTPFANKKLVLSSEYGNKTRTFLNSLKSRSLFVFSCFRLSSSGSSELDSLFIGYIFMFAVRP